MKKIERLGISLAMLLAFIAMCIFVVGSITTVSAAQFDNWASNQIKVESPDIISEDNAYIIFSEKPKMKRMSFLEPNGATRTEELYSEQVEFGGIPCRQVYKENTLYIKMDDEFANDEDRIFSISFDYWNYGGGGNIYIDYYPAGSDTVSTLTVLKLGLDSNNQKTESCWYRATVCIIDAQFGSKKMANGADFRIRSGAYNAFSKFEVKNLSQNGGNDFLGVYNSAGYEMLRNIGHFSPYEENFNAQEFYSRQLTREEALVLMIKGYGMEGEALTKNLSTAFTDISAENIPYVALAESMGVVKGGGILNKSEPFTQKELLQMYMNLLSFEVDDEEDIYIQAREKNVITDDNLIFQPERIVDMDTLSGLSQNVLFLTNEKTGYNAFTAGINDGKYNLGDFMTAGNLAVVEWMKNNTFKLPKSTHYDAKTGRTYYSVNFFGQHAAKSYYTMNCMANDNKRLYFKAMEKYIMEYNIETEMCRYIDVYHGSGCLVTPLDNLWYINPSMEIVKVDLDTYEKTIVAKFPEWQKYGYALQINNDESKLSCWFVSDGSGEIDNSKESRLPVLDLKTGEWDLRYKYGFSDTGQLNPNHMCINPNPEYDNLLFFAHEGMNTDIYTGSSTPIPDRTWVLDFDTGIFTNAIKQKWYVTPNKNDVRTGRMGEGGVHEAWSYDGEWIFHVSLTYYANYLPYTIHNPDAMIAMVRKDFTDKRLIPADYAVTKTQISPTAGINHAMISYDNRFIASDCQYSSTAKRSDLYIFDTETGESQLLAITPQSGKDPGHTHPQFSPDDRYVIFGQWTEDMTCAEFAWMDVSDITKNPAPGGRVQVSEYCEVLSYDCDMEHSIKTMLDSDGSFEYAKIPRDHYMYVDVKKELIESDNTPATIKITYKDDTRLPIKLVYYTWNENTATRDINVLKESEIYIDRTATGKIITKTFKFDDICFGNMQILGTDFRIGAVGAEATILSVEVSTDS